MIDLEVTLFYIPLSGFRVCNLYNRAEVRPSQIVNTRVHNLQIIETQIKLAKVIQISLAERIAVFRHQLFCGPLKMRRVPEKAVFGTECLRKRLPYTRSPFFAPNAYSVHQRPLSCTECQRQKGERVRGEQRERSPGKRKPFFTPNAFENASRTRSKLLPLQNFELIKARGRPKRNF